MSSCSSSSEDDISCDKQLDAYDDDGSDADDDDDSVTSVTSSNVSGDEVQSTVEDFKSEDEGDEDGGIRQRLRASRASQGRNKLSEFLRSQIVFSDKNICSLINKCRCKRTRLSDECGNDYKCANTLGSILQSKEVIRTFRKKFWTFNEDKKTGCITRRRFAILQELQTLYLETDGVKSIDYKIAGHKVCKNFFFEASAISERMFNDAVAYVLGLRTSDDMENFFHKNNDGIRGKATIPKKLIDHCSNDSSQHVVKFLNHYFTYSVEWCPRGKPLI